MLPIFQLQEQKWMSMKDMLKFWDENANQSCTIEWITEKKWNVEDLLKIHSGYTEKKTNQNQAGEGGKGQENIGQEYIFLLTCAYIRSSYSPHCDFSSWELD